MTLDPTKLAADSADHSGGAYPTDPARDNTPSDVRRYADAKDADGFDHAVRRERLALLRGRLAPFIDVDRKVLAGDLIQLVITLLAEEFPAAPFTPAHEAAVRRQVHDLSPDLIAERALNAGGFNYLLVLLNTGQQIALDYFPDSHVHAQITDDERLHGGLTDKLAKSVSSAVESAIVGGLSPYGAATVAALHVLDSAIARSLHWSAGLRVLVQTFDFVHGGPPDESCVGRSAGPQKRPGIE